MTDFSLSSALSTLAGNLPLEKLKTSKQLSRARNEYQFKLLARKGVFPYEYVNSWERFEECSWLSIETFYSSLYDEGISSADYQHAKTIWKQFGIKNVGEYSDLYLETDVLLLADIFENFREVCFRIYKLDPAHYITAPSLGWDAMLKTTAIKLKLLGLLLWSSTCILWLKKLFEVGYHVVQNVMQRPTTSTFLNSTIPLNSLAILFTQMSLTSEDGQ